MKHHSPIFIFRTGCAALLLTLTFANTVEAEEVTFEFSASVTTVIDPMGLSGLQVGNQIDGTYTFEDTTPGRNATASGARYDFAVTDAVVALGDLQMSGITPTTMLSWNRIDVGDSSDFGNGNVQDIYDVQALLFDPLPICPAARGVGGFNLRANAPSNFIVGGALPTIPPDFSLADRLNTTTWVACQGAPEEVVVVGVITRLELANSAPTISCGGFESPMDSGAVKVRQNRVLPLKAQMFDSDGFEMTGTDLEAPPTIQVLFDSGIGDAIDVTAAALPAGQGTEGNQFEYASPVWRFNLKTQNYSAAGTYTITMVSGDSSEYVIGPTCEASFIVE